MAKSSFPGVGLTELGLNPRNITPDIEESIGQDFAYLMAYNQNANLFTVVRCDPDGRILTSNSDVDTTIITPAVFNVSAANTQLLAANPNRRYFSIWNIGFGFISILGTNPVTYASGLKIPPFQRYYNDTYIGAIYATNSMGTAQVLVVEN